MGIRTVRLDDDAEKALQEVMAATGLTASAVLKQGLETIRRQMDVRQHTLKEPAVAYETKTAYSIYQKLDLGPGGYAIAPSTQVRESVRSAIGKKLGR